jgi:hypothetical protein
VCNESDDTGFSPDADRRGSYIVQGSSVEFFKSVGCPNISKTNSSQSFIKARQNDNK